MTTKQTKNLDQIFDVEILEEKKEPELQVAPANITKESDVIYISETTEQDEQEEPDQDSDVELAITKIKGLIDDIDSAISDVYAVAQESEQIKAYDTYNQLVRTQGNLAKTLVDIKRGGNKKIGRAKSDITNNIVFNGSTSELMKLMATSPKRK